jgi:hypothetical protein
MRDTAILAARSWQVDPALTAAASLATVAAAIGKGAVAVDAVRGMTTPANVFILVGAPRSYGKGAAHLLAKPITEFRYPETNAAGGGNERRLWTGNFTTAGLLPLLKENGEQLLSLSTEAGDAVRIALGKFDRNGKGDLDLLLAGYSVEPYGTTRAGSGTQCVNPCLTIFWAAQPCIVRELSGNREALERGMLARILPVLIEPESIPPDTGERQVVSEDLARRWAKLIGELILLRDRSDPLRIKATPEATQVFLKFHNESVLLRNEAYRDIEGELGRYRENAIRLALGQVLADHFTSQTPLVLDAEHAERGIALMRFFARQQLLLLQPVRVATTTARAAKLTTILQSKGGSLTLGALRDSHNFSDPEVRRICLEHPREFELVPLNAGRPGRPTFCVRLIA